MKFFEWLTSGAKLKAFWLRDIKTDLTDTDKGSAIGVLLLILIDVVNLRQHPVCIRNWDLEIHADHKIIKTARFYIPDDFKVPLNREIIDVSKERLTQKSFSAPIEYGKAMRGWIAFVLPGITQESFKEPEYHYVFIAEDAFGKKHEIKCRRPNATPTQSVAYYESAGQQVKSPNFHFDSSTSSKP